MTNKTEKTIEERLILAEQGLSRANRQFVLAQEKVEKVRKQRLQYEQFGTLMARSDAWNKRFCINHSHPCNLSEYPSLACEHIDARDKVASLLWDAEVYFFSKAFSARGFYDRVFIPFATTIAEMLEEKYENLRNIAREYHRQMENRTMNQSTYEGILNGTEPKIGKYLKKVKRFREKIRQIAMAGKGRSLDVLC